MRVCWAVDYMKKVGHTDYQLRTRAMIQYPIRRLIVRSCSRKICVLNCPIARRFERHLGSTAAHEPVKFESDSDFDTRSRASETLRDLTISALSDTKTRSRQSKLLTVDQDHFRFIKASRWTIWNLMSYGFNLHFRGTSISNVKGKTWLRYGVDLSTVW